MGGFEEVLIRDCRGDQGPRCLWSVYPGRPAHLLPGSRRHVFRKGINRSSCGDNVLTGTILQRLPKHQPRGQGEDPRAHLGRQLFVEFPLLITNHFPPSFPRGERPLAYHHNSASVGLYAIQIAAMYGLEAITTCSPRHADHVRSLGASHVFDYNDDNVVEKIRAAAPTLKYVFDTIGTTETSGTSSRALCPSGGTLCTVRPGGTHTEEVVKGTKITYVLVWTAFLKEHRYGDFHWPVREIAKNNKRGGAKLADI